ncbi:hypothetical protein CEUSTIGMA_g2105.t1 [Chlamydomonas eustigma]|uniref:Peptidase C14 caspase domain-containing protein n=1 Tax=Chlamydomonas eustigma TaxID=1157962 RepID=A0A250WUZ5_9CHLO|nr:hypothetical protein CEUSTIGMA_g2105.t1 [Chlamydomonas eustigma]|eukprot:GAX74657.1 hypothetical protein CEUSTIGMA_g2105.t1 [Chlamydomonas eustigma]
MWGPPYGYAPPFPASPYGNASPYAVAQPSYGSNPQYGPSPVPVYPAPSHGPPTSSSETTNYPIISNTPSKEVEYATAGTAALGTPVQPSPRVVPVPMAMPPAGGPQKKAVLVGCSYRGTSSELRGCTNDIQCMAHALQRHFGFTDRYILMLRDDGVEKSPDLKSTRYNIFRGIQWLLADMQPGSSLVFHFSGHGSQQRCRTGDELDGMDETICPSDFMSAGQIIDNELNQYLVCSYY